MRIQNVRRSIISVNQFQNKPKANWKRKKDSKEIVRKEESKKQGKHAVDAMMTEMMEKTKMQSAGMVMVVVMVVIVSELIELIVIMREVEVIGRAKEVSSSMMIIG